MPPLLTTQVFPCAIKIHFAKKTTKLEQTNLSTTNKPPVGYYFKKYAPTVKPFYFWFKRLFLNCLLTP